MPNQEIFPLTRVLETSLHRSINFSVVVRNGQTDIDLLPPTHDLFRKTGANMSLLQNIGDKDPEQVLDALIASIPERKPNWLSQLISRVLLFLPGNGRTTQPT